MWCSGYRLEAYKTTLSSNLLGNRLGCSPQGGVFPRIASALCLPLTIGFMASNSYALSQGVEQFSTCANCFGKWEILFGAMSPLQALCFDIVLFSLALIILLFHPTGVLHSRPCFIKSRKEEPKLNELSLR